MAKKLRVIFGEINMDWKNEIKKEYMSDYSVAAPVRMSRMISQKTKSLEEMMKKVGEIVREMQNLAFDNEELEPKISKLVDEYDDLMFEFGSAENFLRDFMEA